MQEAVQEEIPEVDQIMEMFPLVNSPITQVAIMVVHTQEGSYIISYIIFLI